jgi:hypothetical protein
MLAFGAGPIGERKGRGISMHVVPAVRAVLMVSALLITSSYGQAPGQDGNPWDSKLVNLPDSPLTFELRPKEQAGEPGVRRSSFGLRNRSPKTVARYRLGCAILEKGRVRPILDAPGPPVPDEGYPPGYFAQDALDYVKAEGEVGVFTVEDVAEFRGEVGGHQGCADAQIIVIEVHFTDRTSWYAFPTGHYVDHNTGERVPPGQP